MAFDTFFTFPLKKDYHKPRVTIHVMSVNSNHPEHEEITQEPQGELP